MKFNFKKVSALGSSLIVAGMSIVTPITAANYPAPFVTNGNLSPTSIVWGSGTGVSIVDNQKAITIQQDLLSQVTSSGGTVVVGDGDSYLFERASGKLC